MSKTDRASFSYNPKSDTFRLREFGQVYFTAVETISDIASISFRTAEVLLFIFNFNRTCRKNPNRKKIETHLNIKNVKPLLTKLLSLELIKRTSRSYYSCTETAPFITDINVLNEYVVALHSLDEVTPEKFLDFMTFVHAIETVNGLETPVNNRRVLARCLCLCEQFRVSDIQTVISKKKLACMYARDLNRILPVIEEVYQKDTFVIHIRETDRQNAIYSHQVSQFQKAKAYVFDYETTNKKTHKTYTVRNQFRNQLESDTLEIADRAIELRSDLSYDSVCSYLYAQIVTKKVRHINLTEAVYWSDKSDCEDI